MTTKPSPGNTRTRSGTQSLERAVHLLRELGTRPRVGWGLTELALRCGIDKATTHRMLTGLVRERMAARHPTAPRYLPGPLLFELGLGLGLTVPGRLRAEAGEPLRRIIARHGGIAALTLASGFDGVCCAHEGKVATKGISFHVGDRRPLVANSAGMAILMRLPAAQTRAALTYGYQQMSHLGEARLKLIKQMYTQSVVLGHGLNQNHTVTGVTGVAMAVMDADNRPVAAVSVSGTSDQFPESSLRALVAAVTREAAYLTELCRTMG